VADDDHVAGQAERLEEQADVPTMVDEPVAVGLSGP